jgi:hypothetical protein
MSFREDFLKLIEEIKESSPTEWANRKGRDVGIGGVATPSRHDPTKVWAAGRDDELDAFRHAYISALATAWGQILSESMAAIVKKIGDYNEKGKPICGATMDRYNNDVGISLAPDISEMTRWLMAGEKVEDKIAHIVADAVRDGRLIVGFNDSRLPSECATQAKIRGKYYVWRTKQDKEVRWEHAAWNGQVFRWDDPNMILPGEDYNCRCRAEPLDEKYDDELELVFKI